MLRTFKKAVENDECGASEGGYSAAEIYPKPRLHPISYESAAYGRTHLIENVHFSTDHIQSTSRFIRSSVELEPELHASFPL